MSDGLYWLASYPKSGNTWVRAFIANLTHARPEAVDINDLHTGAMASSREWIEPALGFDTTALSHEEIDRLRPAVYRWCARHSTVMVYHKIHDAYTFLPDGAPLIPPEATRGVLYLVRNPLDVAISFAHHSSCSIDQAITHMANPTFTFCGGHKRLYNQLRQWLLSWSAHVLSWAEAPNLNRLIIRYEDMKCHSCTTFHTIAAFLQLPTEVAQIAQALHHCDFTRLQQQEAAYGFQEKAARAESFFRKGIVGDWQHGLSPTQIKTIIDQQGAVMQRFGYLDAHGQPITHFDQPET